VTTAGGSATPFDVTPFQVADASRWDAFVSEAPNGTFLHTRRYLGYHRDRFDDASLLVHTAGGELLAVLPVARAAQTSPREAVSHPGITFGGLVSGRGLRGERLVEAMTAVLASLNALGFESLDYRPVPAFVRRQLGDEDTYAVYRLGGERTSCALSAVVDLGRRPAVDAKKRNMLRKAQRSGVELHDGLDWLAGFWGVLTDQLSERHAAVPVHSLAEITELAGLFPDEIGLRVATTDGAEVVAGALTYRYTDDVIHTQYLTSNDVGRKTAALELVCDSIISDADSAGLRYVSFGPSTHEDGRVLNDSLYRFKHSFGAMGVTIESYRIPCRAS
jgi:Acetyltransferase (GNAT) domain